MSLLRLTEASDCIQHPHWMYRKCFSILICYEQAYVSTLTLLCLCRLGEDFWEVDLSPCDVVMSWLRLKPPMEYILHPWEICIQSVWHIDLPRIDLWVPPYIVMPVKVRSAVSRVGLSGIWGRQQESPCDVMMTWLRLKSPVKCIPHPYDTYTKCFSLFICWGFTCGSTLTVIHLCRSGVGFWDDGGRPDPV